MKHIMLDLETLGTTPGCVVLSIGAVFFDPLGGLGEELYGVLSIDSCTGHGLKIDPNTQNWWNNRSEEAQRVLLDARSAEAATLIDGLQLFTKWVKEKRSADAFVWGNGSDFDQPVITAAYNAVGMNPPWRFWNNRCFRTLKALYPQVPAPPRVGTYHNALDDAKTQALHAIEIHKYMRDMQFCYNGRAIVSSAPKSLPEEPTM